MERLCGNIPCFLTNESKYESHIPLIYQNPHQFYFPYEMDNPTKIRNSKKVKKYDFANENKSYTAEQNLKRVKSQATSNLWASQHMSLSNNASTISQKQETYPIEVKQNINPRLNAVLSNQKPTNIYFDNQLYRSKSSQKLLTTGIKTNQSQHNFTQVYPEKQSYEQRGHFDIVPVSQYHSLIQKNHQMKRIIEQEYRPLKNCYQSLRQQQKDRQKLIMLLEYKVKQLGQKLKQRSMNTMNYMNY